MADRDRQMYQAIIDFLPDATFVIDRAGTVISWNRAMEEITGVAAGEMIGRGDYAYAVPFYGVAKPMLANLALMPDEEVEKRYNTVTREGETLIVDIFIPDFRPGGAWFWAKATPLYDSTGKVTGAIETIRDITARKHAEQEMERARRELGEIIDFLPDATFVIDRAGTVISWNRAMEETTGIAARGMIGRGEYAYAIPFYGVAKPMLANLALMPDEEVEKRYHTVKREGETLVVDIFIPDFRPGGAWFWAKATPLYDSTGKVTGAIETIRDITVRKRAEQEMERARRELGEIIDFLPDATFVIDRAGTVISWNRAMAEMAGVGADEMVGKGEYRYAIPFYGVEKPMLANLALMPDEEVEKRYHTVKREGETLVVDIFIPDFRPGGAWFWAKATPLYDSKGNLMGAIESVRDITERREMEERIARSSAELSIAAEIQQSFLPGEIPAIKGFEIAGRSIMAKEVGGDFFDVIPFEVMALDSGTLGITIADVSGKGVPAALFMALSRIVVRVNALWHTDPARAISAANDIITADSPAGMFVTLFYGSLSEKDRTLHYVNAGHNPPLVYSRVKDTFSMLTLTGIALGVLTDQPYESGEVTIGIGDIAVLYTDGITECINDKDEMFGETRLQAVIRENKDRPAGEILEAVLRAVKDFTIGQPQFDDITLLVIRGE